MCYRGIVNIFVSDKFSFGNLFIAFFPDENLNKRLKKEIQCLKCIIQYSIKTDLQLERYLKQMDYIFPVTMKVYIKLLIFYEFSFFIGYKKNPVCFFFTLFCIVFFFSLVYKTFKCRFNIKVYDSKKQEHNRAKAW